ncbi:hypothetical protein [Lacisediminihabitans profunda]|uniref:hypothetical protein n=1 Tax=Lacisediminihabitans profunda TaxID=2594790 RepID=UPI00164F6F9E|nr:hypothetical protein [Lacisediminihabitans profunda]
MAPVELIGDFSKETGIMTGPSAAIANLPMGNAGYLIGALFIAVWGVAVAIWKFGRTKERWSTPRRAHGAANAIHVTRSRRSLLGALSTRHERQPARALLADVDRR